ncbi:hypothetical protein YC2023_033334 [Brassica napus]
MAKPNFVRGEKLDGLRTSRSSNHEHCFKCLEGLEPRANEASLISFAFLDQNSNLSRVIDVFYRYTDAYTNPEFLKEHIVCLLIENIPN